MYVFMYFDMFYILWPSGETGSVKLENKMKDFSYIYSLEKLLLRKVQNLS
jgi:hypothetical protein